MSRFGPPKPQAVISWGLTELHCRLSPLILALLISVRHDFLVVKLSVSFSFFPFLFISVTNACPFLSDCVDLASCPQPTRRSLWATSDAVIPVETLSYNDRCVSTGPQRAFSSAACTQ